MNGNNPYKQRRAQKKSRRSHPRRLTKNVRQARRDLEDQSLFPFMEPIAPWDRDDQELRNLDPPPEAE